MDATDGGNAAFAGVKLTSAFAEALPELAIPWESSRPERPELLVLNRGLAGELGLDPEMLREEAGVRFLLGNALAAGSRPVAQAYAGHQFGGYSPRLGDGRALLLGEIAGPGGAQRDLHLKGSGRTPFARADGFAAVGPMLREYLMGEAMHALGIPTTRALAVVGTGRLVPRDGELEPGAVLVRVAASHLRVGTFQFARSTRDIGLLRRLVDFALARHAPAAGWEPRGEAGSGSGSRSGSDLAAALDYRDRALRLLEAVVSAQAELVAAWMHVGFVHGVMNTDNMTISGETIDYGPCAFIDAYDPAAVFSSIDHGGRYAYGNQPGIALWNLTRFAESLLPLLGAVDGGAVDGGASDGGAVDSGAAAGAAGSGEGVGFDPDAAELLAVGALERFDPAYRSAWLAGMRGKLGLGGVSGGGPDDATVSGLASQLLDDFRQRRVDFTLGFRALAEVADAGAEVGAMGGAGALGALYPEGARPGPWIADWLALGPDPELIRSTSPAVIPRNHLVDEALAAAEAGDLAPFERMLEAVGRPFEARQGFERYARPAPPGSRPFVSYCGT